jgi:hypothetical protein
MNLNLLYHKLLQHNEHHEDMLELNYEIFIDRRCPREEDDICGGCVGRFLRGNRCRWCPG